MPENVNLKIYGLMSGYRRVICMNAGLNPGGQHSDKVFYYCARFCVIIGKANDPVRRETILLRLTLTRDPSSGKVILSEQSYCPCFVMEEFRGEHYVIVPADKRYNDGFYSKQVPANFRHIREIVGEEHFSKW